MKRVGVRKRIDRLGRMVIPKEMRELFGLKNQVELIVVPGGILLRNPEYHLEKNEKAEKL